MIRKRVVASIAVVALLVTAGCLGGVTGLDDGSPTDAGTPTEDGADGTSSRISVGASGEVTAEPDRAVLTVGVEATAADPETAREQVAEDVSSLRAALADVGLGDDRVTTREFVIREDHASKRDEATATRYVAIHSFEIEIGDVDRVGSVIETATADGATNVGRVRFTLSEGTRSELREKALTNAMANARADAETLAADANLAIAEVDSVTTSSGTVRPYRTEANVAASDGATGVESGPVLVTARVQVTYNATG